MTIDECAHIEEILSAMQDGAATPEERALAERHISGCARCQATAAAFGQVDRQVRRYLMATPVPEIGAPWRSEPLVLPQRRGMPMGHWRVTAVGLAAIFVMLLTASILTFRPFAPNQPESASFARPTTAADTHGGAPVAAPAASSAPMAGGAASAAPTPAAAAAAIQPAPTRETARSASGGAAPATAAAAAAASAPPAASTAPAPAATGTSPQAPLAAGAVEQINPAQRLRLSEAATLTICRPGAGWCDTQPRTAEEQANIVALLNRPLARLAPPAATGNDQVIVLTFRFASGEEQVLTYQYTTQRLTLPGNVDLQGSPELTATLTAITTPR
jgi:hypothetical protein